MINSGLVNKSAECCAADRSSNNSACRIHAMLEKDDEMSQIKRKRPSEFCAQDLLVHCPTVVRVCDRLFSINCARRAILDKISNEVHGLKRVNSHKKIKRIVWECDLLRFGLKRTRLLRAELPSRPLLQNEGEKLASSPFPVYRIRTAKVCFFGARYVNTVDT